jgi:hypothetical protein
MLAFMTRADQDELSLALSDAESIEARRTLCIQLGAAFTDIGRLLFTLGSIIGTDGKSGNSPFLYGSDATVGLGMVGQIAGELIAAASGLVEIDKYYAAMTLVRQVVETEYLAWAFSSDSSEAESWLRSSPEERQKIWQPRHIRSRSDGRFRGKGYHLHCERGGHPTPDARFLLPDHSVRLAGNAIWVEIAVHGISCWDYFVEAIVELDHAEWYAENVPKRKSVRDFHEARAKWMDVDRFPVLSRRTEQ